MPEGPEAHSMADQLRSYSGYDLVEFQGPITLPKLPLRIINVIARGKRPIIVTSGGFLVTFLSMTDRWLIEPAKWTKAMLVLELNGQRTTIYYDDQRGFGRLHWLPDKISLEQHFSSFGPDYLRTTPDSESYLRLIRSRKPGIELCKFLLEPKYCSTIGNYLKSDILYVARLHPQRTLGSLSDTEIETLRITAVNIPRESYMYNGLTIKDYLLPSGEMGSYPRKVYGRDHDDLGNPIIKSTFSDRRATYWVPSLQI